MQVEEYIVDIIRAEMELDRQHVWIQSQNRKIPPNTEDLFVVVGCVDFKPISSKSYFDPNTDSERQVAYGRAQIQVDIFSRSNEARVRRAELLMALNSFYSKGVQDKKQFKIFELPSSFVNLSGLAGGSDINRFALRFYAMISEVKEKSSSYYEVFNETIYSESEQGVDIMELENLQIDS